MKRYEQKIMTWCTSGPHGAATHHPPGPYWRVVGFAMASANGSTYATIVYERENTDGDPTATQ